MKRLVGVVLAAIGLALSAWSLHFMGVYGWKDASLPEIVYGLLLVGAPALLAVVAGVAAAAMISGKSIRWSAVRPWIIAALTLTVLALLIIILGPE